ncbi:MAG: TIGR04283 family arsenosugar biosynthesis glycosyltransferase [Planctomycetota bacterium]|jgi:rSAM/selenodomain-associated transferase 2
MPVANGMSLMDEGQTIAQRQKPAAENRPRISVIIPALHEEESISATIATAAGAGIEIIVVDGGSRDRTVPRAVEAGARVLHAPRGRALQMNAGAAVAHGDILLFLHADTTLPLGYSQAIFAALESPDVSVAAFRLAIDARGWLYRVIEKLVNIRSRLLHLPYGDQGFAMRTATFRRYGGFPEIPVMEDFALVRGLRREGRIAIMAPSVLTSARRWLSGGVVRTTLINQLCLAAYCLGFPVTRIARWRDTPESLPLEDSTRTVAGEGDVTHAGDDPVKHLDEAAEVSS